MAFSFRREILTRPIFRWARGALPKLSDTEREAIEAGDVWWDADLFTGDSDWKKLLSAPPAKLSDEERAFLDGAVETLCSMLDDWRINWTLRDLAPEVWAYLKSQHFFAIIIPKSHGGLGFSAYAHSEVVRKIASRSVSAAVTAMVPNSLGPGELLMQFGTKEQQDYWLPRLADGREIPCFGLTSPEAGSDAASMIDSGIVCDGTWQGKEVLGIRLNWHKRYITLAPVATVLGLAFRLTDPDRLLGGSEDIGITLALVPTHLPGIEIGRRHLPALHVFQNGPNSGHEVFIPMDHVIGGPGRVGQGWKMLMSALAAGRGISLPSLSAAGGAFSAHVSGAYARIRRQFGIPIGEFEGIQERLARIAANAYVLDAARKLTCAALDQGHHPAVITAIMKERATEKLRVVVNDAMDIHGGKGIMEGPRNYLGALYRAVPIGITVEGANILTRNLIEFGQGAIRSHPYLLKEITALGDVDTKRGLATFDAVFWRHVSHSAATFFRSGFRAWTNGRYAPTPEAGKASTFYRRMGRYASAFALVADFALLTLGGALKRKEMLSARLGDVLAELYLLSSALKRWEDEGRQDSDFPLLACVMEEGFATIAAALDGVIANLPNRLAAGLLRMAVLPFGARTRGAPDRLKIECARLLLEPSPARERLIQGIFHGRGDEKIANLDRAFKLTAAAAPLFDKMRHARVLHADEALKRGILGEEEAKAIIAVDAAIAAVIEVDDFDPRELSPLQTARSQAAL